VARRTRPPETRRKIRKKAAFAPWFIQNDLKARADVADDAEWLIKRNQKSQVYPDVTAGRPM